MKLKNRLNKGIKLNEAPEVKVDDGDPFPNMRKWWTYPKEKLMSFVYWTQRQMPPDNPKDYDENWQKVKAHLTLKYPPPTNARIEETKTMKLKNILNEVDYSTMRLKSNIDQKWDSAKTMQNDLSQWIESTYAATGNVGDILKALEQVLTRTKNVSKEAPGQFYKPGDYKIGKKF